MFTQFKMATRPARTTACHQTVLLFELRETSLYTSFQFNDINFIRSTVSLFHKAKYCTRYTFKMFVLSKNNASTFPQSRLPQIGKDCAASTPGHYFTLKQKGPLKEVRRESTVGDPKQEDFSAFVKFLKKSEKKLALGPRLKIVFCSLNCVRLNKIVFDRRKLYSMMQLKAHNMCSQNFEQSDGRDSCQLK